MVKRLSPSLDSVRVSNIYARYACALREQKKFPFGRAVIEELENDLLIDVIIMNGVILHDGGASMLK